MAIKDLFQSDIYRTINGVVYADKLDHDIIWQELDEYVITRELMKHINTLFDTYVRSLSKDDASGQNGVWISGFFGSGKSHFLKILSYLFENRGIKQGEVSKTALDFFREKISDPMSFASIEHAVKTPTEVIMFNIDSLSFQNDEQGAILKAFYGVFNRKRGYCFAYPHVAHVEHFLTRKGVYKDFVEAFADLSGSTWYQEREDYVFYTDELLKAIIQVLPAQAENKQLLEWITNGERSYPLSIDTFANLVAEYIEEKGRRILFMADEMGQFIGSHSDRMLNLQTIVENLGTRTKGKAWVFVTSQEDIDAVLGDKIQNKSQDFSKIQARFKTRLSLSSSSIAEVIQKRLLRKKVEKVGQLETVWSSKRDIILNQLSFTSDTPSMACYQNKDDFSASYPFIPYQFNLVQDVFDAIRSVGATGLNLSRGERSMLDAFQTALKQIGEKPEGAMVPLHAFFPTIESFLDSSVSRSINNALDLPGLEPADHDLLKTLFLIRYLKLRRIKGCSQNLAVLSVAEVDTDMVQLKRSIEDSLGRLEKQNLISLQGEEFIFLTIEEQGITREIQHTSVPHGLDIRELAEFINKDEFDGKNRFKHTAGKTFDLQLILDGMNINSKGDFVVEIVSPLSGNEYNTKRDSGLMYSMAENRVLLVMPEDKAYFRDLRLYLQTYKFLSDWGDRQTTHGEETIIGQKKIENAQRRGNLIRQAGNLVQNARIFVAGSELKPSSKGSQAILMEAAGAYVDAVYKKLSLLENPVIDWAGSIRNVLSMSSDLLFGSGPQTNNLQALEDLRTFIELSFAANKTISIDDCVKRYTASPYGWPDGNVQVLLVYMLRADEIKLYKGNYIDAAQAYDFLTKSSQYSGVSVIKCKVLDQGIVAVAQKTASVLFNNFAPNDPRELAKYVRTNLKEMRDQIGSWQRVTEHAPETYPGIADLKQIRQRADDLLAYTQHDELLEALAKRSDELTVMAGLYGQLHGFFQNQITLWRQALGIHDEFEPHTSLVLSELGIGEKLAMIETILADKTPYGRIKDLGPAVSALQKVMADKVAEKRSHVLDSITANRDQLSPECESLGLSPDDTYRVKQKLNQLHKQAEQAKGLAQLVSIEVQIDAAYGDALVVLNTYRNAKPTEPASKPEVDTKGATPAVPKPQPKPIIPKFEVLRLNEYLAMTEVKTLADVDLVVNSLKMVMKQKLAQGKVIRLE